MMEWPPVNSVPSFGKRQDLSSFLFVWPTQTYLLTSHLPQIRLRSPLQRFLLALVRITTLSAHYTSITFLLDSDPTRTRD